jgi:hypothetical protein
VGATDSPLQVINLNIKKLVQDLYTTMKVPRRHNRYMSATLWRARAHILACPVAGSEASLIACP